MTPEQVALLDQLKKLIQIKCQAEDFIPIHLRIYNKSQELENEPDIAKKEIMANRLSPFSKCEVWRIEIQLEGNLNRYKENFNLDEDELTLKIFKDFNKRKKIDFLNRIIEATEARLPEKPRPHGWLFEQPITFPPLL